MLRVQLICRNFPRLVLLIWLIFIATWNTAGLLRVCDGHPFHHRPVREELPTILELVLAVLEAQRELNANEDLLAQSRTTQTVNLIALYKALGGGWQSVTLQ
jgi:hypothetical protein